MTWFRTLAAPDLTDLFVPVVSTYALNVVFLGRGGSDDPEVRSYVHSYILSCDEALRSYDAGSTTPPGVRSAAFASWRG